jgi:hypothetical protein
MALPWCLHRWLRVSWLRHVFVDGGYAGEKLKTALVGNGTGSLEIIKRPDEAKGFVVLRGGASSSAPLPGSTATGAPQRMLKQTWRHNRLALCCPRQTAQQAYESVLMLPARLRAEL